MEGGGLVLRRLQLLAPLDTVAADRARAKRPGSIFFSPPTALSATRYIFLLFVFVFFVFSFRHIRVMPPNYLRVVFVGFVTTGWPFPRGGQFPVGDLSACCFPSAASAVQPHRRGAWSNFGRSTGTSCCRSSHHRTCMRHLLRPDTTQARWGRMRACCRRSPTGTT